MYKLIILKFNFNIPKSVFIKFFKKHYMKFYYRWYSINIINLTLNT